MFTSTSWFVTAVFLFAFAWLLQEETCFSFQMATCLSDTYHRSTRSFCPKEVCGRQGNSMQLLFQRNDDSDSTKNDEAPEYRNIATQLLSNFMQKSRRKESSTTTTEPSTQQASATGAKTTRTRTANDDPLQDIDFQAPKLSKKLSLDTLAAALDAELVQKEWFVTGQVNPIYFADSFVFQDPDVRLEGIEAYARGVNTLFDQTVSRAEIISTVPVTDKPNNVITCTWRLSGKANIGPFGLTIKPYIVYTDFTVDTSTGLIVFQEDRFDLPQWDILLSSLFPFLIRTVTAPPAPPVEPRIVVMPKI